jgi:prepilin-type N-terminal cleavage/methylation domain-containing protein
MNSSLVKQRAGFTLVELAIVLVVIALIVAGVLVGQDLIQQAQLRKTMNQLTAFSRAANVFRLKYDFLPGDFPSAYRFLGAFSGCSDTENNQAAYAGTGCNGNGDGAVLLENEDLIFWAHLARAGLVSGAYTGLPIDLASSSSAVSVYYQGGVNSPKIGTHGAMVAAFTFPQSLAFITTPVVGYNFAKQAKLSFLLGSIVTYWPNGPGFTVNEAYILDKKMDDGNPYNGRIYGFGNNSDCVTSPDSYSLGATGINCLIGYISE